MIIDTHSHLNFKAYDNDRDEVIKRAQKQGVVCIDVGTKFETSKRAIKLAEKNENIFAAIGMHPIHLEKEREEFDAKKYKKLALSAKRRVVAVGEIGLDYYYRPKSKTKQEQFKQKQKEVFLQQLEMAEELNLPVIIHCRMAHQDLIEVLKSEARNPKSETKLRGVIHCFTGTVQEMREYLNLGFYTGLNGIIFKLDLDEVIKNCPLDKILVETDCPYLTPPLARRSPEGEGGRNEPIFVKHVIQKITDLRGISFDEVVSATTSNAQKLFRI